MVQFREIIDTYTTNYNSFEKGKVIFDCDYGELVFYKRYSTICVLQSIYIFPEYRNKGLCRGILRYLIDKCDEQFIHFCVEDVLSKFLYDYLLRFTYKNKKFKHTKSGFVYVIKN